MVAVDGLWRVLAGESTRPDRRRERCASSRGATTVRAVNVMTVATAVDTPDYEIAALRTLNLERTKP
jgi:hypothetical protein